MVTNKKNFFFNWFFKKKTKNSKNIKSSNTEKIKKNGFLWSKISNIISSKLSSLFSKNTIDEKFYNELEEKLILSDFGVFLTNKIINKIRDTIKLKNITDIKIAYLIFKNYLNNILCKISPYKNIISDKPHVILIVGINGVGKTSAIGKLARKYLLLDYSVILAAGDTFRPGAIEQLQKWGILNSIPVISQMLGADSASVIYDAMFSAKSKNVDIVIADTAGRLHNNNNLMQELNKIISVMKKINTNAPNEILLVLDANNGQNSIQQTEVFHRLLNINGIILTKLDSTAKGGVIFSIVDKFSIPISYISTGEGIDDLHLFNNEEYLNNFFLIKNK